mgnify:CR=1 FL=1|jgi:hypothetical protein
MVYLSNVQNDIKLVELFGYRHSEAKALIASQCLFNTLSQLLTIFKFLNSYTRTLHHIFDHFSYGYTFCKELFYQVKVQHLKAQHIMA